MVLAAFVALTFVPAAGAAPLPLDPTLKVPSQYPTIQQAINAAKAGDTILVAPGTYVEHQRLTIDKSVTIEGAGVGKTIVEGATMLTPDIFGNAWTIEIGDAATVTLSGFTLVVALQCIIFPGPNPLGFLYAGGGIGVGGSATLNLKAAAITTSGATEGAACGGPSLDTAGSLSFGTAVGFGLDYVTGSPPANELVGTGTVSGVTISGFGGGGPGIAVGGLADSPAGSYALIANDQIATSADDTGLAAITVGSGGNTSAATIVNNMLSGQLSSQSVGTPVIYVQSPGSSASIQANSVAGMPNGGSAITVQSGASASIVGNSILTGASGPSGASSGIELDGGTATIIHNSIVTAAGAFGIAVFGTTATITSNVITGSTSAISNAGIFMFGSSATISSNSIGFFECEFDPAAAAPIGCGPSPSQVNAPGIADYADAGLGTTIQANSIFDTDIGVQLAEDFGPCLGCVVKNNVFVNNVDFGLEGVDGDYSFGPNLVVGGLWGVGSVATGIDTTVTLSHVSIVGPSVGLFYIESDNGFTATISGT